METVVRQVGQWVLIPYLELADIWSLRLASQTCRKSLSSPPQPCNVTQIVCMSERRIRSAWHAAGYRVSASISALAMPNYPKAGENFTSFLTRRRTLATAQAMQITQKNFQEQKTKAHATKVLNHRRLHLR
jgi:hypothetical protein